jgi:hypothetical protein
MKLKPEVGGVSVAGWSAGADCYMKPKALGAVVCWGSSVAAAGYMKPKAEGVVEEDSSSYWETILGPLMKEKAGG